MAKVTFKQIGEELGIVVDQKRTQYGPAAARTGEIIAVLYPNGIPVHAYGDALLIIRTLDKICRLSQRAETGGDLGGESPWNDLAGYGLLGVAQDAEKAVAVMKGDVDRYLKKCKNITKWRK